MPSEDYLDQFYKAGAILKGHFLLSSGMHSDTYIQCAKVFENPRIAEHLCASLSRMWADEGFDVVAGPAYGGIILAYELARQLGIRSLFLERLDARFTLRRGFKISRGERVLVAEDVITTGGSVMEVIDVLSTLGAKIAGIASLVHRGDQDLPYPHRYLVRIRLPLYRSQDCPMCKDTIPLIKPGSRKE
jgi:orotate phosphoribosyltransferase